MPTYPHQVYRLVCSYLRNLASAVDQNNSSQLASLIFDPTGECNLNKFFFVLRERQLHLLARKSTPVDVRKRDVEACVLTPLIPAGRCVGALWVACWACPTYHHLCLSQQATRYMGFLEQNTCFYKGGCFGCGEIFWCSDWHEIVILFPLHFICQVERYAAHRRPPHFALCCKKQQQTEDASRAAVHVESCDTMRSRKAQCQAPPDKPETGDTDEYHSRERRSCAGQKIV